MGRRKSSDNRRRQAAPPDRGQPARDRQRPDEARLLELQHLAGNQAVTDALVQRQGRRREYVPEMSVKPDEQHPLVGQRFREQLTVRNYRKAPQGTEFHWGGGIHQPQQLEFNDVADTSRRGTSRLEATALKSGTAQVQANLQHQVPGGPVKVWPGPRIPVIVPRPRIVVRTEKLPAEAGGSPDPGLLAIGDRLKVTAQVVGVSSQVKDGTLWSMSSGTGAKAGATGVRMPKTGLPTGSRQLESAPSRPISATAREYQFTAKNPGPFDVTVGWELTGHAEQPPVQAKVAGSVEMGRRQFIDRCARAHSLADAQYDFLRGNNHDVAIQYGQAWKRFKGGLDDERKSQEFLQGLVLNAVFAFVPGGIGGIIGARVKKWYEPGAPGENFMPDAMKDLFKDTMRRYGGKAIGGMNLPAYEAFPPDPLEAQNKTAGRTDRESGDVKMMVNSWQEAADEHPEVILDFDPVETIRRACTINGNLFEAIPPPTEKDGRLMEKGFWKEWILKHGYFIRETYTCGGTVRRIDDNVGRKIKKAIRACASALSEDGDDWISEWGGVAKSRLQQELERTGGSII